MDEEIILEYFPSEHEDAHEDLLSKANFQKVAIVCMREQQARLAAETIRSRTGADVIIVSSMVAGLETDRALSCDVVLFVWLATTHAVFRAFDDFDRKKLCYVQGTGVASIIRSLERWSIEQLNLDEL